MRSREQPASHVSQPRRCNYSAARRYVNHNTTGRVVYISGIEEDYWFRNRGASRLVILQQFPKLAAAPRRPRPAPLRFLPSEQSQLETRLERFSISPSRLLRDVSGMRAVQVVEALVDCAKTPDCKSNRAFSLGRMRSSLMRAPNGSSVILPLYASTLCEDLNKLPLRYFA